MRPVILLAFVAIVGCGNQAPTVAPPAAPPSDPVAARRDDDAQAAFSLDAAEASISDAMEATKRLAPIAGGEAKAALLAVADRLDASGTVLADHIGEPPPLDSYRKDEPTEERRRSAADGLEALDELRKARHTLDDLAANVPPEHAKPLRAIQAVVDEAIDAVESGIERLGGKVAEEANGG